MKSLYLIVYNALSAVLWVRILLSAFATTPSSLYSSIEPWVRGTQTLAIAEIFHAALGILLLVSPKYIYNIYKLTTYRNNPRPGLHNVHPGLHPLCPSMGY